MKLLYQKCGCHGSEVASAVLSSGDFIKMEHFLNSFMSQMLRDVAKLSWSQESALCHN